MALILKNSALAGVTAAIISTSAVAAEYKGTQMSPSFKQKLQSADNATELNLEKEPKVQLSGYLLRFDEDLVWSSGDDGSIFGLTLFSDMDIFASIHMPTFWLDKGKDDWLIYNPYLFGEGSITAGFTLRLWLWNVTLRVKAQGIKFSPLDFQLAWNLDEMSNYCYSVGYFQEVFDFLLEVETDAYECNYGVIGWATDTDTKDCWWRNYSPSLPLLKYSLFDEWDYVEDYVPWQCFGDQEIESNKRIDPETGEIIVHPHGWEPSNNVEDSQDDTDDADGQDIDNGWDEEGTTIWVEEEPQNEDDIEVETV